MQNYCAGGSITPRRAATAVALRTRVAVRAGVVVGRGLGVAGRLDEVVVNDRRGCSDARESAHDSDQSGTLKAASAADEAIAALVKTELKTKAQAARKNADIGSLPCAKIDAIKRSGRSLHSWLSAGHGAERAELAKGVVTGMCGVCRTTVKVSWIRPIGT